MPMEKQSAHRQWKVYDGPRINPMFSGIVCMISANERLITVITEDEAPVDPGEWPGIARLIAAAPDLLEALRQMVVNAEGDRKEYRDCYKKAVAALSRATSPAE